MHGSGCMDHFATLSVCEMPKSGQRISAAERDVYEIEGASVSRILLLLAKATSVLLL
jgi:hypothetical protein